MAITEDLGISFIQTRVAEMGYFFREQLKHDFGIDAHIETANPDGKGTGRNIAIQIKSGSSYTKIDKQSDIAYYAEERHIKYWAEHSLPVILTVYDPERKMAWWCDVKAYISRNPLLLLHGPYKIIIPNTQQFTEETKDILGEIAAVPQSPLTLEKQHFSILSRDDISTIQAKRYRADILVGNVNDDLVRLAIYQATEYLKNIVEHSSDLRAEHWGNQKPHLVTLFVYRDLEDKAHTNWIARSVWRDPSSHGAKQFLFGKPNDYTEDIEIDFADNLRQQGWRLFVSERVITKYQFLKKVEHMVAIADDLISQAMILMQQKETQQITENGYVTSMSRLAQRYTEEVEHKYDDGTTGPSEAHDAEVRFVATIGSGGNLFLAFTPRGLENWTNPKQRDYMVKSYLKKYDEDRTMLGFELKKLSNR